MHISKDIYELVHIDMYLLVHDISFSLAGATGVDHTTTCYHHFGFFFTIVILESQNNVLQVVMIQTAIYILPIDNFCIIFKQIENIKHEL